MILLGGYAILAVLVVVVVIIEELSELNRIETIWAKEDAEYKASLAKNDVVY